MALRVMFRASDLSRAATNSARTERITRKPVSLLGSNLDRKSTWSLHVKCPGMTSLWRIRLKAVVFQALIDLIDALLALLAKADMECAGILDLASFHQGKAQIVIVEKRDEGFVAAWQFAQPEIFFEKIRCCLNISDTQIEMVQFHG